jgi:prepilin signal peptidase PulO-like enzyme (type II secretory pathway)
MMCEISIPCRVAGVVEYWTEGGILLMLCRNVVGESVVVQGFVEMQSRTRYWNYCMLAVLITGFVVISAYDSQIGLLPAVAASVTAVGMIAIIWTLGQRTKSAFGKAVAGIAVALILVLAGYLITGNWPSHRYP